MSKPAAWSAVGMRHFTDHDWTRIAGCKVEPGEVEGMAAAGDIYTRIRRDGQRELLEIKSRR